MAFVCTTVCRVCVCVCVCGLRLMIGDIGMNVLMYVGVDCVFLLIVENGRWGVRYLGSHG